MTPFNEGDSPKNTTVNLRFTNTGFLRLSQIISPNGPIPVSKSTWWAGVKDGRFPKPVKLGPQTTAWRVEAIQQLIDKAE